MLLDFAPAGALPGATAGEHPLLFAEPRLVREAWTPGEVRPLIDLAERAARDDSIQSHQNRHP